MPQRIVKGDQMPQPKPRHQPTRRKTQGPQAFPTAGILIAFGAIALVVAAFALSSLLNVQPAADSESDSHNSPTMSETDSSDTEGGAQQRVSFLAIGDNLPEITLGEYADSVAGAPGDGLYDYSPIYAPISSMVASADLAYINQEVHLGGDDIGLRGYPSFNAPEALAGTLVDIGFDMVASATNHSYDWGEDALVHSVGVWAEQPVLYTGTARSQEEADLIKTIERNGITFSMLNYTYGVNGYEESEIPAYAINYMHEERISADIAAAREKSDVVIVAMHWGTENLTAADETQQRYAQLIADAGADLIVGSHPHVIGPLEWVIGASGNKTLVAYSLGNCLSLFELPSMLNDIGGMLTCDFVKTDDGVSIENIEWMPLVNHTEPNAYALYPLESYTAELASRHRTLSSLDDPLAWIKQTSQEIIGGSVTTLR